MIFVSYSWIKQNPDSNVLSFVANLRTKGYDAKCDVMDIQKASAINFPEMMAQNLFNAEKVIIILSSSYKNKADSFKNGVGDEFRYIISDISNNTQKYILVSFSPLTDENIKQIVPDFLKGREIIDLSAGDYNKLLCKLTNTEEYHFPEVNPVQQKPISMNTSTYPKINSGFNVYHDSTPFFDYRIRGAFPGVRGLKIFDDPKTCVDRLELLLRQPLSDPKLSDPIWYFRGSSCLDITSFKRLSDTKCLLGVDEYEIDKIGVYIDSSYYRDFIYVQTKADNPSGVYPNQDYYENPMYKDWGYYSEEFGLFNNIPITRAEFDDGAAVINGQVVPSNGQFQLRVRYLTPYNFVICAKFHPFNSNQGDLFTKNGLNAILKGFMSIEDFAQQSLILPRNSEDI